MPHRISNYLICYDIAAARRLNRMEKLMNSSAIRIQKSVYLTRHRPDEKRQLLDRIEKIIDPKEDDVRIYRLTENFTHISFGQGNASYGLTFMVNPFTKETQLNI